jgi:hypothetical protein
MTTVPVQESQTAARGGRSVGHRLAGDQSTQYMARETQIVEAKKLWRLCVLPDAAHHYSIH